MGGGGRGGGGACEMYMHEQSGASNVLEQAVGVGASRWSEPLERAERGAAELYVNFINFTKILHCAPPPRLRVTSERLTWLPSVCGPRASALRL